MVDIRDPVPIQIPGGGNLLVGMEWKGRAGPVLSGHVSKMLVTVHNTDQASTRSGSLQFLWILEPPWPGLQVMTKPLVPFVVGPGKTERFVIQDEWLLSEGRAIYWLQNCTLSGLAPNSTIMLNHPLSSYTVFERSTYTLEHRRTLIVGLALHIPLSIPGN